MAAMGTFIASIAGPVVKRALTALGIGVVSYAAISTALTAALGQAKSSFGAMTGDAVAIITIAGIPTALSILAGGLIARAAMMAVSKLQLLK